ncbi:MAG TPA: hypothetical protein PLC48_04560 [Ferruginibacter sp.]|nr:hypothetical protein [Ferruginibacter sp.]
MEEKNIVDIWRSYDQKLEESRILNMQSWVLNLKNFEFLQSQKAKSVLNRLTTGKWFTVILGIIWVVFLVFLVLNSLTINKIFFVVSAGMIAIITGIAIVVYLKQIFLIRQINHSNSIVETQDKLAHLKLSTLWVTRILFLQCPFHTTWFLNWEMLKHAPTGLLIFQVAITVAFTFLSVWLYRNISDKNMHKKWFKVLFGGSGWTSLILAKDFIEEIDEYRQDHIA